MVQSPQALAPLVYHGVFWGVGVEGSLTEERMTKTETTKQIESHIIYGVLAMAIESFSPDELEQLEELMKTLGERRNLCLVIK